MTFYTNLDEVKAKPKKIREPDLAWGRQDVYKFTWKVENSPGIKEEPYMTSISDYLSAIYFQFVSYNYLDSYYNWGTSWEKVSEYLRMKYKGFFSDDKGLQKLTNDLTLNVSSSLEKARNIYNYVRNDVGGDDYTSIYGKKKPHKVVTDLKGSNVDKNLLLITLLRHAGFEAYPVLISTRSHGRFEPRYISLQNFNHVIVYFHDGETVFFLDGSDKYCPFGMLPAKALVGKGLLVNAQEAKVINIPYPKDFNPRFSVTTAILDHRGNLNAKTYLMFEGYRASKERRILDGNDSADEYIQEKLADCFMEVSIDSFQIYDREKIDKPLSMDIYYQVTEHAQVTGEMIYLNPTFLHRKTENIFKKEMRHFRVDYSYKMGDKEQVEIYLPSDLQIVETLGDVDIKGQFYQFVTSNTVQKNVIQFQRQLLIGSTFFTPQEYPDLRDFYGKVVSADQGQIVLKR